MVIYFDEFAVMEEVKCNCLFMKLVARFVVEAENKLLQIRILVLFAFDTIK